jgi:hypothetical protein
MSAGMADDATMALAYQTNAGDPYADTGKLIVQFHKKAVKNDELSIKAGRPMFEDKEFVRIIIPGDKDNIVDREVWDADFHRFPKQYEAFKRGQSEDVTGTPLHVLAQMTPPIISMAQVEELKYFHVRTAEQLVGMSESLAQKFAGINELQKRVRGFLEQAKSAAPAEAMRAELEKRDHQVAALERMLKAQGDMLEKLMAPKALSDAAPSPAAPVELAEKPKRMRARKNA